MASAAQQEAAVQDSAEERTLPAAAHRLGHGHLLPEDGDRGLLLGPSLRRCVGAPSPSLAAVEAGDLQDDRTGTPCLGKAAVRILPEDSQRHLSADLLEHLGAPSCLLPGGNRGADR